MAGDSAPRRIVWTDDAACRRISCVGHASSRESDRTSGIVGSGQWAVGNRQSALGNRHWVCGDGVGVGVSEWTLTGTTLSGQRIEVRGLDLLEFDGHRQISRKGSFRKIVA